MSVPSHQHERIRRANRKQSLVVPADRTPRRQHNLHDFAQHLYEVIHEVDKPLYTFY
jgi:hypothetical protein